MLHLRNLLRNSLDYSILEQLGKGEEVFITILGNGEYEFTAVFFAIVAFGAVAVPLCKLKFCVWRVFAIMNINTKQEYSPLYVAG